MDWWGDGGVANDFDLEHEPVRFVFVRYQLHLDGDGFESLGDVRLVLTVASVIRISEIDGARRILWTLTHELLGEKLRLHSILVASGLVKDMRIRSSFCVT